MNKIIDQAKAHYAALCDAPKQIEVPEWKGDDGKTLILFATPITLSERAKAQAAAKNSQELAVEIIILKAKNSQGQFAFTRADKFDLLKCVDGGLLDRIASQIIDGNETIIEQAEKN